MRSRQGKFHVFNQYKCKPTKTKAKPNGVMSKESLHARLDSIPIASTTFRHVTDSHEPEIRARIISASSTVAVAITDSFHEPAGETVDLMSISCVTNTQEEDVDVSQSQLVELPSTQPQPRPEYMRAMDAHKMPSNSGRGHHENSSSPPRTDMFGPSTLPPAFLPNYVHEGGISSIINHQKEQEGPAYARRSMSEWFNGPSGDSVRVARHGRRANGHAIKRLGKSIMLNSLFSLERPNENISVSPIAIADISEVASHPSNSIVATSDSEINHTAAVSSDLQNDTVPHETSQAPDEYNVLTSHSCNNSTRICNYVDLLGAIPQNQDAEPIIWFEQESLTPIDDTFSEDGDGAESSRGYVYLNESKLIKDVDSFEGHRIQTRADSLRDESLSSGKDEQVHTDMDNNNEVHADVDSLERGTFEVALCDQRLNSGDTQDDTNSVDLSDPSSEQEAKGLRTASVSSGTSQSSLDFHLDNTFLGSTCARDVIDRLHPDTQGQVFEGDFAEVWVQCVAIDHANRLCLSPGIAVPGVTFITADDVPYALSYETQCRAKLGRISLFEFMKKLDCDQDGMIYVNDILPAFRQAAVESQKRVRVSRDSPTGRMLRCMSKHGSKSSESSSQSRGRRRVR